MKDFTDPKIKWFSPKTVRDLYQALYEERRCKVPKRRFHLINLERPFSEAKLDVTMTKYFVYIKPLTKPTLSEYGNDLINSV